MTWVLVALGALSVAYGVAMAALYPAGGFFMVWIALGAGLLAFAWARRSGAWGQLEAWVRRLVCGVAAAAVLAVGVCCGFIATQAAGAPPAGVDYVLVLGAGLNTDGTPRETLRYRLDAALAYLAENPGTTCIVSGGQGRDEVRSEASSMREYLVEHGLDESRILSEDRSTSTMENFRFSRELMSSPDASVAVVTNDFHLFRAMRIARRQGLTNACGLAAPSNPFYLPNSVLRECFALTKDALVGNV